MKASIEKALNDQINAEIYSAYLYKSMEMYLQSVDLPGMANWMNVQVQEELAHAEGLIQFVNLRYEIRCGGDDPIALAAMTGEVEAETFLRTMGFGHGELKVDVVDASAIWDGIRGDVARRRGA